MADHYDVIVVGAGPSGCATSLTLARHGYDVLLLEKAKIPGHRNMTGGVLFGSYLPGYGLVDLLPHFEHQAPLERRIDKHDVLILDKPLLADNKAKVRFRRVTKSSLLTRLGLSGLDCATGHDFTVLRAVFDKWLSRQVIEAGGLLATDQAAEELLRQDHRVVGLRTNREELYADLVVDASGVTSTLVTAAGLRERLTPPQLYHGVKHVWKLDAKTINDRFGAQDGIGRSMLFFGNFMQGVEGGAFLYTNRETLSVGIVVSLESVIDKCTRHFENVGKPLDVLDAFERHPLIANYLEGGTLVEYSAHNIPKGPKAMLSQPYTDGFLVVGDALGAFVKIGAMIDGMRRAVATGIMAAETFVEAKRTNDFSARRLEKYLERLSPVYGDIRRSEKNALFTEGRLAYSLMPKLLLTLGIGITTKEVQVPARVRDARDMLQKIQQRTGLLDYEEDKTYAHIKVNYPVAAESTSKAWVPACPFNCYLLVTSKGVFASYRDLYLYNLDRLREETGSADGRAAARAKALTFADIADGKLRFDHVACVGCGTCGAIGPSEAVAFGHEHDGHGVKYRYG